MPRSRLAFLVLLPLLACGEADPVDVTPPVAEAPPVAAVAAKASERMRGTWTIVLGPEEKRQVEVMRLALKDPAPTEEDLTKANLSQDEKMMVGLLSAARAADPNDPKIKEMESAVASLDSATLRITDKEMVFTAGTATETSTYVVQAETDGTVTVQTTDKDGTIETANIQLEGADSLSLVDVADPSKSQKFTRK